MHVFFIALFYDTMASNIISDGYHRSDEANTDSEEYEEIHGTADRMVIR